MTVKRLKCGRAVTLVEVMVAMAVLAIAALGAVGYQYHAVRHTGIANAQIVATRTAQLLLEDWKSTGGSIDYDPILLGLGFSTAVSTPGNYGYSPSGNPLRDTVYAVTIDGLEMLVLLAWRDIDYDSAAEVTLRELAITIRQGQASEQYPESLEGNPSRRYKLARPITLTTYVRLDAASG